MVIYPNPKDILPRVRIRELIKGCRDTKVLRIIFRIIGKMLCIGNIIMCCLVSIKLMEGN